MRNAGPVSKVLGGPPKEGAGGADLSAGEHGAICAAVGSLGKSVIGHGSRVSLKVM
jgi:hypothetical protein